MKEDFPLPLGPLRRMQSPRSMVQVTCLSAAVLRQAGLPEDGRTIRDNGGSLSVGQRKKLLLLKLRLRLEEAPVVILDELTAGLDAETAGQVFRRGR